MHTDTSIARSKILEFRWLSHLQSAFIVAGEEKLLPIRKPVLELPPEILRVQQQQLLLVIVLQIALREIHPVLKLHILQFRPAQGDDPQLRVDLPEDVGGELHGLGQVPGRVQDVEDGDEGLPLLLFLDLLALGKLAEQQDVFGGHRETLSAGVGF